jgi:hypothetical protein
VQYEADAFSIDPNDSNDPFDTWKPTIVALHGEKIGQRSHLITLDISGVNTLYPHWSDWSSFSPFTMGGQAYVIAYKGEGVVIGKIEAGGNGLTEVFWARASKEWTFASYIIGNQAYIFEYKSDAVAIDKINAGGTGLTEVWRGK